MGLAWFPNRAVNSGRTLLVANEVALVIEEGATDGSGLATIWITGVPWSVRCAENYSTVVDRLQRALAAAGTTIVYP